jgi:hypothetical protein
VSCLAGARQTSRRLSFGHTGTTSLPNTGSSGREIASMRTNCPHCGADLPPTGDAYCSDCHQDLDEPTAAARAADRTGHGELTSSAACKGDRVRAIIGVPLGILAGALLAGVTAWSLSSSDAVLLVGPIAHLLPANRHVPLLANLWAHSASCLVGLVGGVAVVVLIWRPPHRSVRVAHAEEGALADRGYGY